MRIIRFLRFLRAPRRSGTRPIAARVVVPTLQRFSLRVVRDVVLVHTLSLMRPLLLARCHLLPPRAASFLRPRAAHRTIRSAVRDDDRVAVAELPLLRRRLSMRMVSRLPTTLPLSRLSRQCRSSTSRPCVALRAPSRRRVVTIRRAPPHRKRRCHGHRVAVTVAVVVAAICRRGVTARAAQRRIRTMRVARDTAAIARVSRLLLPPARRHRPPARSATCRREGRGMCSARSRCPTPPSRWCRRRRRATAR